MLLFVPTRSALVCLKRLVTILLQYWIIYPWLRSIIFWKAPSLCSHNKVSFLSVSWCNVMVIPFQEYSPPRRFGCHLWLLVRVISLSTMCSGDYWVMNVSVIEEVEQINFRWDADVTVGWRKVKVKLSTIEWTLRFVISPDEPTLRKLLCRLLASELAWNP